VLGVVAGAVLVGDVVGMIAIHYLDRWAVKHRPGYLPFPRPIWRHTLPSSWWWRKKWRP